MAGAWGTRDGHHPVPLRASSRPRNRRAVSGIRLLRGYVSTVCCAWLLVVGRLDAPFAALASPVPAENSNPRTGEIQKRVLGFKGLLSSKTRKSNPQ